MVVFCYKISIYPVLYTEVIYENRCVWLKCVCNATVHLSIKITLFSGSYVVADWDSFSLFSLVKSLHYKFILSWSMVSYNKISIF